jgi:hypothetical protein
MAAGGGAKRGKEGWEREPEVETTDWGVWDLGMDGGESNGMTESLQEREIGGERGREG